MYVSGRGTNTYGTVFPALLEAYKLNKIKDIALVTTNLNSAQSSKNIFSKLCKEMDLNIDLKIFPKNNNDEDTILEALNEFKPDASIIVVPDHVHYEIALKVIKKGIHCLVAKPMTDKLKNAKVMYNEAIKANVLGLVEFHKRFDESNILIKDQIKKGDIGELLYSVIEYSQQKKIPTEIFKDWSSKTNVFQYLGVHYVDLIYWITGFLPEQVTAWGQKKFLKNLDIDTWDSIQVVIKWKDKKNKNFISNHITNWIDPNQTTAMSDQKITIVGTDGRIISDQKNRGIDIVNNKNGAITPNPYFTYQSNINDRNIAKFSGYGIKSIISFIDDVINFKEGKIDIKFIDDYRSSFKQSIISTAILEAALNSLESNNKTITIEL